MIASGAALAEDPPFESPLPAEVSSDLARVRAMGWAEISGGPELLDPIAAVLSTEPDAGVRAAGRDALGRLTLSEDDLIAALGGSDEPIARSWAAYALGRYPTSASLDALLAAIDDRDESVRREVYLSLGRLGDRQALPHLTRAAVRDPSSSLRRQAESAAMAVASGRGGGLDVSTELALLEAGAPEDRLRAARELGESGDWRAVEPLLAAAREGAPELREAALLALGHLGDHRAVPALLEILEESAGPIRYHTIAALAWLADDSAQPALEGLLDDPDPSTRQLSVRALAWSGAPGTVARLAPLLDDPSEDVRTEVVLAMDRLREPERVGALIDALDDPSPFVRAEASRLLAATGSAEAGPALVPLLQDRDPLVRLSAAAGVGELGETSAIPDLQRLYERAKTEDERRLYTRSLEALGAGPE